jgi:tRNA pseudouridine32 synthase/23S rRNA pseudouridine746 synthase
MDNLVLQFKITADDPEWVCDALAGRAPDLSKGRIKEAMEKGAVWLRRGGKRRRVRRARTRVAAGDVVELFYDRDLLDRCAPEAKCLHDLGHYSVWFKPTGLMAQGTDFGDHCSLMRQAQVQLGLSRQVLLVHRLDREAQGLMLLAHDKQGAASLSQLLRQRGISKRYRVEVLGDLGAKGGAGLVDLPLDGKSAITEYEVLSYDPETDTSMVEVILRSGRRHQIRRHLDMAGHPVMGDPRYGQGNKNRTGLRLVAVGLRFVCPFAGREVEFVLPPEPEATA